MAERHQDRNFFLGTFDNFPNAHKTKSAKVQEMPQTFAKKVEESIL